MYRAGRFFVVGHKSHTESFIEGMEFVLGYLLVDMASMEHSHAWRCIQHPLRSAQRVMDYLKEYTDAQDHLSVPAPIHVLA